MQILTDEDRRAIETALENAKALKRELTKAKQAGIDVADAEARLREAEAKLRRIKNTYFPS